MTEDFLLLEWLHKKPNCQFLRADRAFARPRSKQKIAMHTSGLYVYYRQPLVSDWDEHLSPQVVYIGHTGNLRWRFNDHAGQWFTDVVMHDDDHDWFYVEWQVPIEWARAVERKLLRKHTTEGKLPFLRKSYELPMLNTKAG